MNIDSEDTEEVIPETPPTMTNKLPALPPIEVISVKHQLQTDESYSYSSAHQQPNLHLCPEGQQSASPSTSAIIPAAQKMKGVTELPLTIKDRDTDDQHHHRTSLQSNTAALFPPILPVSTSSMSSIKVALPPSPGFFYGDEEHRGCSNSSSASSEIPKFSLH